MIFNINYKFCQISDESDKYEREIALLSTFAAIPLNARSQILSHLFSQTVVFHTFFLSCFFFLLLLINNSVNIVLIFGNCMFNSDNLSLWTYLWKSYLVELPHQHCNDYHLLLVSPSLWTKLVITEISYSNAKGMFKIK